MKNHKFKEYSPLLCVKINLFTAFILFVLFICSKLFMGKFQNDVLVTVNDLENGAGAMMAIVLIGGLVGMLLISCSILLPLIIPLFSNFKDNLKALIGIVICNFGISYFLLLNFTLQLALCYFLSTLVGTYFSMYFRFEKKNSTKINI